ncbi:MAG: GGDEF domain-containing protein, partial [Pseudomonadales bacterium]
LKQINDQHGHAAGDSAIKEFAALTLHTFRESDVVARLGGDEFCVLLTGASEAEAEIALSRLSEAVADHNRSSDVGFPLAFSAGVAECAVERSGALAEALHQADELMYHQKRNKPDRD